jgi:APA family basic amino acid/polyamine antiporter
MNLWARKPLRQLVSEADESEKGLKKSLGPFNLVALGIGAIIGAGLFVRTAIAAGDRAGPSVTLGFVLAAVGCAFSGLCYAEFASMIPIAGSAYTYSYATMGELVAWVIGWDLVLEYAVGAATVSIAWSEYLNKLLEFLPGAPTVPFQWSHSPFQTLQDAHGQVIAHGIMNLPALFIVFALTLLLIRGMKESAVVNGIIVIAKVAIVLLVIALGWGFMNPVNHAHYIPPATMLVGGDGVEHHFGGALGILTGIAPVQDFRGTGREASVAYAITKYMPGYGWLAKLVTVAILAGFSSVILVMLMGQSRVFYSMSRDGLVPSVFSDVHPRYHTPYKSNLLFFVFVGLFAAFVPGDIVGDMCSIGTLFAFVLVCIGVWILRVRDPNAPRQFRTPLVPLVPILGIAACTAMIVGLEWLNWLRLGAWLVVGLVIYFAYGAKRSKLTQPSS